MDLPRALRRLVWLASAFIVVGCRGSSSQGEASAKPVLDRSERYGAVTVRYPSSFTRLSKPGFMVQRGDESFALGGGPVPDGEATDLVALSKKVTSGPLKAARESGSTVHETVVRPTTCAGLRAIETRTLEEDNWGKPMLMRGCVFVHGKSGYFLLYRGPRGPANDDPLLASMLASLRVDPADRDKEVAP